MAPEKGVLSPALSDISATLNKKKRETLRFGHKKMLQMSRSARRRKWLSGFILLLAVWLYFMARHLLGSRLQNGQQSIVRLVFLLSLLVVLSPALKAHGVGQKACTMEAFVRNEHVRFFFFFSPCSSRRRGLLGVLDRPQVGCSSPCCRPHPAVSASLNLPLGRIVIFFHSAIDRRTMAVTTR
jgi:hypothetical protein